MQHVLRRQFTGWCGVAGAGVALITVLTLSGCPGTLDPDLAGMAVSEGGSTGSGGNGSGGNGSGGNTATGGSSGTGGGGMVSCTGNLAGAAIVTTTCAISGCHSSDTVSFAGGGLDLTVDNGIGSRLVGAQSRGTTNNMSLCMGNTEAYLDPGSNPATGLLIEKVTEDSPPCGDRMPLDSPAYLSANQETCLIQWATTLTSP